MEETPYLITRREALRRTALLLGGTLSAPTIAGVLAGCGSDRSRGAAARPTVLTERQREQVATIAEHIIPETDTPGARAVNVDAFIDEMLARYYPAEERELFLAGLASVDERARRQHSSPFLECSPEQQRDLLVLLDRESLGPEARAALQPEEPDIRARTDASGSPLPPEAAADSVRWIHGEVWEAHDEARPFFRTMKELTLVGYYTSKPGATVELRHEAVPGRWEGCIPFSQVGRTWAV